MVAITGAYRYANSRKILEIANEIPIEIELRIMNETMSLSKDERSAARREQREQWRSERELYYETNAHLEFEQLRRRQEIWCLTETGPFRTFLRKIGKEEEESCRLCDEAPESAEHLLFRCEQAKTEFKLEADYNTTQFEKACANLIAYMSKLR